MEHNLTIGDIVDLIYIGKAKRVTKRDVARVKKILKKIESVDNKVSMLEALELSFIHELEKEARS